jgi:hypothetical protein
MSYGDEIYRRDAISHVHRSREKGVVHEDAGRRSEGGPAAYVRENPRFLDQSAETLIGFTSIDHMET